MKDGEIWTFVEVLNTQALPFNQSYRCRIMNHLVNVIEEKNNDVDL